MKLVHSFSLFVVAMWPRAQKPIFETAEVTPATSCLGGSRPYGSISEARVIEDRPPSEYKRNLQNCLID